MQLHEEILECFRKKMHAEKEKFEYINPHFMQEILSVVDNYYDLDEETDDINDWIISMFGA